jgi:putative sigma-54 modulation protein
MRIDVIGRNIPVTDAIREYAEEKVAKLPKYFDGVQSITVALTKDDHHKHGSWGAELRVDVEKHEDFISTAHGEDLYATIDLVVQKGARQLTDFKEKLKMGKR